MDETNPNLETIQENLHSRIKRIDEDRWLSSRYAPPDARDQLMTLYAFQLECVRATTMSEVMLRHIRIQWWRDAVSEIAEGHPPRRHELVLKLADLIKTVPELYQELRSYLTSMDSQIEAEAAGDAGDHMIESGAVLAMMAGRILSSSAPIYRDELEACGRGYEAARLGSQDADARIADGRSAFGGLPADLAPAVAHIATAADYHRTGPDVSALLRRWRIFWAIMSGRA